MYGSVNIQLHEFLVSAFDGSEWSAALREQTVPIHPRTGYEVPWISQPVRRCREE